MRSTIRLVLRQGGVGRRHGLLQVGRAFDGVDGAAELDEQAVARLLEDAALMTGDERLEDVLAPGSERRQRARLVALHAPAVADHVGGQNRGEAALDSFFGHVG